ncbi:MAG: hypothetical protein RSH52_36745, partial [Janthinobacterium sp.]
MMSPFVCLPIHYGTAKRGAFAADQDWQTAPGKSGGRKKKTAEAVFGACRPKPANGALLGGGGLDFSVGLGLGFFRLGGG